MSILRHLLFCSVTCRVWIKHILAICLSYVVFQAIISNYQDLMPPEFENYFCYSAMWAFGGTLVEEHRPCFSQWWREQWNDYVMLPGDEEVSNKVT